ncbi:MAG TPA: AgmX/PglI C-terminal domain-containing protein [Bdellovibrionota bacterium]|nr:AgmX/PglI C-terminal domain-containing protein [Bdellovibrionota bacterium]
MVVRTSALKIPSDRDSEIFFDPKRLVVDFRKRPGGSRPSDIRAKVLRVVVQCFGWVIEDRFFSPGSTITVGAERGNTFRIPTPALPESHALIQYRSEGGALLTINKHIEGVLQMGDKLTSLLDAVGKQAGPFQTVEMAKGARGCLEFGHIRIYFEEIPDPERVPPVAIFKYLADPYLGRWVIVSLALHLMILLVVKLWPAPPPKTLEELTPQFQKILVQPSTIKPYQPKRAFAGGKLKPGAVGMEGEGARAPGAEGRRGRGIPGAGRRVSSGDIRKTGILDVFTRSGNRGAFSELIGGGAAIPGSVDSAFNRAARYGLPGETELREGKGLKGTGTGGGGLSTSIGQGLGTKGRGGGAKGPGLADFGTGKSDTAVSASIDEEEVFVMGNIPKDVIARIIANYLGQIRYCYERQLTVQPNLRGKVVTDFIIGLDGSVTSTRIKQSTLSSPPVEVCVQNVIKRIQFPKPGGGIVQVIYPFLFRVAG